MGQARSEQCLILAKGIVLRALAFWGRTTPAEGSGVLGKNNSAPAFWYDSG